MLIVGDLRRLGPWGFDAWLFASAKDIKHLADMLDVSSSSVAIHAKRWLFSTLGGDGREGRLNYARSRMRLACAAGEAHRRGNEGRSMSCNRMLILLGAVTAGYAADLVGIAQTIMNGHDPAYDAAYHVH